MGENKSIFHARTIPLVSDFVREVTEIALFVVTSSFVSMFGILSNTINIAVYLKIGIKYSASAQFFSLSVTDLFVSIQSLTSSLALLVDKVNSTLTALDPFSLAFYGLPQAREKVYSLSIVITFLLSVELCFCVLFPFTVQTMFTKSSSAKIIAVMAIVFGALLIPDYLTERLAWRQDYRYNTTRILHWISYGRVTFDIFKDVIFAALLSVLGCVTIIICSVIMIRKIHVSRNF